MARRGKKYKQAFKIVEEALQSRKHLNLDEALDTLLKTSTTKFDSSCEVHMLLGIDPKQGDQMVRSTVTLPNGIGKDVRIIAFVPDDMKKEAIKAGALDAGAEDLIEKILKGWMDFDIAVAHPDIMKSLGKVAKILGPKGLMPNPKAGTVTPDIANGIQELKLGKIEFRNDKLANLHNIFGKISFGKDKLLGNLKVYFQAILDAKPSSTKGNYVRSVTLATTMGPGIPVDPSDLK